MKSMGGDFFMEFSSKTGENVRSVSFGVILGL